ncbi:amidohydrolase family-domain-containing protein [Sphaerosporella brunnea]|uniref:Amidohydrolase family-domain-containing protein n=1 Tax=Sphaerosporella brunnea TaxID=1250544 RepID=A0A5J5F6D8_9PEZI|nr:amidohydrolase family-domain-containing protein [Sphaerosporella brunnea]
MLQHALLFLSLLISALLVRHLHELPLAFRPQGDVHCYGSIATLSASNSVYAPGCLRLTRDGRFSSVFSANEEELRRKEKQEGWNIDLTGHALPGLWDGHAHLLQYGEMLASVQLHDARGFTEIHALIGAYRQLHPGAGSRQSWIIGMGWDQSHLPHGLLPSAKDLPADLYILLHRIDFHCIWVSPPVLSLLGPQIPAPPEGGTIPSAGVFCDNAIDLILPFLPPPTKAQKKSFVLNAQRKLHSYGMVGIHDAGVVQEDRELYEEMAETGELQLRIYAMVECRIRNSFCPEEAKKVEREDGMLIVRSVKLFADGALGSWGAALLAPYSDKPSTNGTMLLAPSLLTQLTAQWSAAGYQVNIHAIGDAANRAAISAIASARPKNVPSPAFRLEHAQIIAPEDQRKLPALGIVASIQPTHATSDQFIAEARLGKQRLAESAYRMKSLLQAGVPVVLGSDFPVEPPPALRGVYAAVTRRDPATGRWVGGGNGFFEEQRLTVWEALSGFTRGVAFAGGASDEAGAVEKGKWADWIVLDRRVVEDPKSGWEWLREEEGLVRETWIRGKRVFGRTEGEASAGISFELA